MKNIVLITGSTDGIGLEAARQLLREHDLHFVMHARNQERGSIALEKLKVEFPIRELSLVIGDLRNLAEVKSLSEDISSRFSDLDVLVNNAGVGTGEAKSLTRDGFDITWQVNYLAPYLLTELLLQRNTLTKLSRIINVSSAGHTMCRGLHFDDLNLTQKEYPKIEPYCQSKLALVMWSYGLAGRLKDRRINVNVLHPGTFVNTKMVRNGSGTVMTSLEDGGESVANLVNNSRLESVTGKYFDMKEEQRSSSVSYDVNSQKKLSHITKEQLSNYLK